MFPDLPEQLEEFSSNPMTSRASPTAEASE